jgi:hypothetical protein
MKNYPEYAGTKVRVESTKIVFANNDWWDYTKKEVADKIYLTRGYKAYLTEKRRYALEQEVLTLKHKLQYQYDTQGCTDDIDFQEYMAKLQLLHGMK